MNPLKFAALGRTPMAVVIVAVTLDMPTVAMAQSSPFLTGATALPEQHHLLAHTIAVILIMALGGMAMANRMSWGWCVGAILGIAIAFGAPQIVTWVRGIWRLNCRGEYRDCSQCRRDCRFALVGATRPPMRWGVTYSALLFNLVFTMEIFLMTKNLFACCLPHPFTGELAAMRARSALLRSCPLVGRTRFSALLGNLRFWKASSYSPLELDLPNGRARRRDVVHVRVGAAQKVA